MTSATEELRRMLDERGVEWENGKSYGAKAVTRFKVNGVWLRYVDYGDYQWLDYHEDEPLTAEQAVESTLGRDRYSYEQFREISNAVGDAMEYAHDRAIEHPDRADPLWSLDEYVNRILKVAFEGGVTLGTGTCHEIEDEDTGFIVCSECGAVHDESYTAYYCWCCGRRIEQ
jgi:hypothetical protein